MRRVACFVPLVLLLTGSGVPEISVPVGSFRVWGIHSAQPLHFVSGGVAIDVIEVANLVSIEPAAAQAYENAEKAA